MKLTDSRLAEAFKIQPSRRIGDAVSFLPDNGRQDYDRELDSDINRLKTFLKRWPRLYYAILYFGSTIFFGGLSVTGALKMVFGKTDLRDKIIVSLGSGTRRFHSEILNLDIYPFTNVDIVADVSDLPFKDNSVDMLIAESLLEHLPNPEIAVREMFRVLKPGGHIYGLVPFLYPFHASPNDYYRWTSFGLKKQFRNFESVDIGMRSGPMSAVLSIMMHYLALIFSFGIKRLYLFLVNLFMVILSPLKIFDAIFFLFPNSIEAAAFVYFLVRKK